MARQSHKPQQRPSATMTSGRSRSRIRTTTAAALAALCGANGRAALAFAPPPPAASTAASASHTAGMIRPRYRPSTSATTPNPKTTELRMMPALFDLGTLSSSVFGLSHQPNQSSLYLDSLPTDLLSVLQSSPSVESEVLADISHVALDLITFTSPTRALLRLSLVLGRCLAIAADWVPDHYLHPEELAFQSFMLSVSVGLLVKTALPLLPAVTHQSSNKYGEKRAYGQMFKRHGGLSWVQTKMILAGGGAAWFELGGGEVVVMDEQTTSSTTAGANDDDKDIGGGDGGRYLYWLQKGEAELLLCGGGGDGGGQTCLSKERAVASVVSTTSTTSSESAAAGSVVDEVAILGELEFARRMQDQSKAKAKAKKSDGKKSDGSKSKKDKKKHAIAAAENMASTILRESSSSSTAVNADPPKSDDPPTTTTTTTKIRAGPSGVTLLRLDADRLLALISDDEALADGIRSIVFAGMQDKLRRVMAEDGGGTADGVPSVSPSYEPDF